MQGAMIPATTMAAAGMKPGGGKSRLGRPFVGPAIVGIVLAAAFGLGWFAFPGAMRADGETSTAGGPACQAASQATADSPSDQAELAPEAIIERAVEAMGGRESLETIKNRKTIGTMEIPAMKMKAAMTVYTERPNHMFSVVESPELGKLASGTDGETFWENSAMQGPRIKQGDELAIALREADFDGLASWRRWYQKVESAGADSVAGQPVWKILMTPTQGAVESWYFSQESNLPVKMGLTVKNEMGEIPVEVYMEDYRQVDKVLMPFRTRQVLMGGMQEMVFVTESVAHNIEIPAGCFDLPPEVQALQAKQPTGTTAAQETVSPPGR